MIPGIQILKKSEGRKIFVQLSKLAIETCKKLEGSIHGKELTSFLIHKSKSKPP